MINEVCTFVSHQDDFGFFFTSGKIQTDINIHVLINQTIKTGQFYSIKENSWKNYPPVPLNTFSIKTLNQKVLVLGSATRNGTCKGGICDGNALYGNKKVMEFDWKTNSWNRREDMAGN